MLATYVPPFLRPSADGSKGRLRRCLIVAVLPVASLAIVMPASAATTAASDAVSAATSAATLTPAAASGTNGWYRGPVTLNLSATDAVSGVQRIEYRLGSTAPFQTAVSAPAPFPATLAGSVPITQEGSTSIGYRAVSGDGSIEATHTITVRLDTVAPVVSWPDIVDGHVGHTATMIPTRTDPSPASGGVFVERMWIDSTEVTPLPVTTSDLATGAHKLSVVASDTAGNAARYDQTFVVTTSFADLDTLVARFVAGGDVPADLGAQLRSTLADAKAAADCWRHEQSGRAAQRFPRRHSGRPRAREGARHVGRRCPVPHRPGQGHAPGRPADGRDRDASPRPQPDPGGGTRIRVD